MKNGKIVLFLSGLIIVLAAVAAGYGLFSVGGTGKHMFTSVRGEQVAIDGSGLYRYDSVSMAAQARGQDGVTLFLGIPLLAVSAALAIKGSFRGRLLLVGTLGYFLYTYMSYSFLSYNALFLVYVALMSLSLFAFILTMASFDYSLVSGRFKPGLPVRVIGAYLLFIAFAVAMLWLGKIAGSLASGAPPQGLEHYSTMVIQAMDLGILVPVSVMAGVMLIRRKPLGYLLASVVIVKTMTLLTSISAMLAAMIRAGVHVSPVEMVLFPAFNIGMICCMAVMLKNVRREGESP
ncbi:hypothetical protein J2Z22_000248 [Paenibacillus forsythiae]|uniref:Uncharacterized protein n=1 Tax=Paenibacillus forsythiae TaxID=365616 RepID=A0ABU3H1P6_9BACL|nr:hypothetical protein [Paenibacillus forsythiae]MDT3424736.1 hypothetical protein [Paenibacillus forsythiae]